MKNNQIKPTVFPKDVFDVQIINNAELTCILFPGSLRKYVLDKT